MDTGIFRKNHDFNVIFKYLWFITGFVVPLCILVYCNVYLIKGLRAAMHMRKECRIHGGRKPQGRSITPTLVAVILMFLFLVTPGEITHFVLKFINLQSALHNALILSIINLMNTLNFSVNFILYCVVNVHFRSTLIDFICCCCPGGTRMKKKLSSSPYSTVIGNQKTKVTNVVENAL